MIELYRARTKAEAKAGEALDQFWTPPALAKRIVEAAELKPGMRVLEPSCGGGSFARFVPDHVKQLMAMDLDAEVFAKWPRELLDRPYMDPVVSDFLKTRVASDAFDVVLMNPPYGMVGKGRARKAADRLHVQHALRVAPVVWCLVRANWLWGQERYQHVLRFSRVKKICVLVHRPSFHGPALVEGQDSARHDFVVLQLERQARFDRDAARSDLSSLVDPADRPALEFWTDDWRLEP